jgi:hypothetical protein
VREILSFVTLVQTRLTIQRSSDDGWAHACFSFRWWMVLCRWFILVRIGMDSFSLKSHSAVMIIKYHHILNVYENMVNAIDAKCGWIETCDSFHVKILPYTTGDSTGMKETIVTWLLFSCIHLIQPFQCTKAMRIFPWQV